MPSSFADTPVGRRLPRLASTAAVGVFVVALAYLVLAPLVRLQVTALEDGGRGYESAFTSPNIGDVIRTTVALAVGSLVLALVLGTLLAWAATLLPNRYRFLRIFPVLPLVVPFVANIVGWVFLFSPGPGYMNTLLRKLPWWSDLDSGPVDVYSVFWIIVIVGLALSSFVYLFVYGALRNINYEYVEAAQTCGSPLRMAFFRVTLPLLRPALLYSGAVVLLLALGQFDAPLLLGTNSGIKVISTRMYSSVAEAPIDLGAATAYGSPLLLAGIIIVVLQRVGLGNASRFVTHGGKAFQPSTRTSRSAVALIVGYACASVVLPLGGLLLVALSRFGSFELSAANLTLDNIQTVLTAPDTRDAIVTGVSLSAMAVVIALPLGFVTAALLLWGRRFSRVNSTLDLLVTMPLGIPRVIFGVGFLLAYSYPPFVLYGSPSLLVIAYVTLMLPFSTRMFMSSMTSLGTSYLEASRVSGAGLMTSMWKVVIPLLRPAFGGAAALMFVLLSHEFSASVLLRTPKTQVMGTILYDYWVNGSYSTVAAMALVMTVVTGVGVALAMRLAGRDLFERM